VDVLHGVVVSLVPPRRLHQLGADVPGGKGDVQQRPELDGLRLVGEVAMPPAAVATERCWW
jgi:hypothetical protein